MLFSEFLTGTGAPCNGLSHIIYLGINRIYMLHDEYTKEEAYKDGQRILEDLEQVVIPKRTVSKMIHYHGLSYSCGYCGMSVNDEDVYCRFCGAEFDRKDDKADKGEQPAQPDKKERKKRNAEQKGNREAAERRSGAQLS